MKKRILSLFLTAALCIGMLPTALADQSDDPPSEDTGQTEVYTENDGQPTAAVAMIGDKMYTSLADAIAAAKESDTISLMGDDISENITVASGDIVIDLNGKTWSGDKPLIITGGNVTVKNGTLAAIGTNWEHNIGVLMQGGTLTIGDKMTLSGWQGSAALWWEGGTIIPLPVGTVLNGGISVRATDENNEKYPISALLPAKAAFAVDGSIINGYTDQYGYPLTDCGDNLTVVYHPSHTTYTNGVCECGYPCTHPGGFDSGACATCGLTAAAKIGSTYYGSLQDALDKAGDGDTVTLCRNIEYDSDGDIFTRSESMVTLDLNGHAIEYLVIGNVEHVGYKDVVVGIAKLTVTDSTGGGSIQNALLYGSELYNSVLNVERGTIANFKLYGGTLNLKGGQIGLEEPGEYSYYNGISAENGDATINISGGTVVDLDSAQGYQGFVTVNVTGGTGHKGRWTGSERASFNISGGIFDDVLFRDADTGAFHISGGSFGKIGAYRYAQDALGDGDRGIPLYNILADGCAFYNQADGTMASSAESELENVTVKSDHKHSMRLDDNGNWSCDCGFTCDHAKINAETGICPTCGMEFAVKVTADGAEASYYADTYDAVTNAPDGATLTLLQNINNSSLVLVSATAGASKSLTLDMNGKNIGGYCNVWVGESGGSSYSLTVIGKGDIGVKISVAKGCTLDMSGWQGTLYGISMSADSKVTLPNDCELSELTAFDLGTGGSGTDRNSWHFLPKGYALQYTDTKEFVPYHIDADNSITLKNVQIVPCTDHNIATDGKCIYCNSKYEASVGDKFYESVEVAIDDWQDFKQHGTLKLYADAATSSKVLHGSTLTIDLNGHKFGTDSTASSHLLDADLTIIDTSEKQNGQFGNLTVDGGKLTLKSGRLYNVTTSADTKAEISLEGGSLKGGNIEIPVYKLLPNGYMLVNHNDFWENPGTILGQIEDNDSGWYRIRKAPIAITVTGETTATVPYGRTTNPFPDPDYTLDESSGVEVVKREWYAMVNGTATPLEDALAAAHIGDTLEVFCYFKLLYNYDSFKGKTHTAPYTITVGKADLSDAEITLTGDPLTFNPGSDLSGVTQTQNVKVTLNGKELSSDEYTVSGNEAADAGKHTLTVTAKEGSTVVTGLKDAQWSIAPYELDEAVVDLSKEYDGTTAVTNATVERFRHRIDDNTVQEFTFSPADYEVKATSAYTSAAVGKYTDMQATVTLKNSNYRFKGGTDTWKGAASAEITWATAPEAPQASLSVVNGGSHVYTLDVSKYLPTLSSGCEFGSTEYSLNSIILDSNYYTGGAEISEDGKLTLQTNAYVTNTTGNIGTIKVKVTSQNYSPFYITVKVEAINQKDIALDGSLTLTPDSLTYGEALKTITITGKMKDADGNPVPGTFSWSDGDVIPDAQDNYLAVWVFTPNDTTYYAIISNAVEIKVNKANSSVTAAPLANALTYNGAEQALITAGTAAGGEMQYSLTQNGEYTTAIPTGKNAGSYTVWYKVVGDKNHTDTEPQSVTVTIARKTVSDPTIEVASSSAYNGQAQEPAVTVKDGNTVIDPSEYIVSYSNNTAVGDGTVTITNKDGGNYIVSGSTTFQIAKGKHTDETAEGTAKYGASGTVDLHALVDKSWHHIDYDYDDPNNIVTYRDWIDVRDNILYFTFADDASKVGKTALVTIIVESTNYEDYTIVVTLTVSAKTAQTIAAEPVSMVYGDTGAKLAPTGTHGTVSYTVADGADVVSVAVDGTLTALKAGKAVVKVSAAGDADYATGTLDVAVTVAKRTLTLRADDKSMTAGSTLPEFTVSYGNFATDDTAENVFTVLANASVATDGKTAGTFDITLTAPTFKDGMADKYEIGTLEKGTLTVNARSSGGGGGSGSSSVSNTYKPTVSKTENGTVEVSSTSPKKGDTVTVTPKPANGYAVDSIAVKDSKGNTIAVTEKDGKFTFVMPADNVTITPKFVKISENNNGYIDVVDKSWYSDAVQYVTDKGLMSGTGDSKFSPNASTTRGMLMTILARYAGQDTTGSTPWYQAGMDWAKANGVSDGTNPTVNITREQLVTMLYRYAGSPAASGSLDNFSDASTVSTYAVNAMQWAVSNGIVNGSNGKLNPKNNATRAEVAAILMRFCAMSK